MVRPSKPGDLKSYSKTTERGYFIRHKWRKDKKRRQRTDIIKPKGGKVTLFRLNDLEFYVYPEDYPDKVFVGIFPMSTVIGEEDLAHFMGIYNRIRWYLTEQWVKDVKREKGGKRLRERIVDAYNMKFSKPKKPKS